MTFSEQLIHLIQTEGPLSQALYMQLCLDAYYSRGEAFGVEGDFVTSPEISPLFGDMLGAWCAHLLMSRHEDILALVELGPGRGLLAADVWRVVERFVPDAHRRISLHLVEASPSLQATQQKRLESLSSPPKVTWHQTYQTLPDVPSFVFANEFFDALPVHAYVFHQGRWCERCVGLLPTASDDASFKLGYVLRDKEPLFPPESLPFEGAVWEESPVSWVFFEAILDKIDAHGGAFITFDYGPFSSGYGDTFQALKKHQFVSPLDFPGEADLTCHVMFDRLQRRVRSSLCSLPLVTQKVFLEGVGIRQRLESLCHAKPHLMDSLVQTVDRLTCSSPTGMGTLFKVLAVLHRDWMLHPLPPFEGL